MDQANISNGIFGGTLRSVLMCESCGHKRTQPEPFLIVSLPLSNKVKSNTAVVDGVNNGSCHSMGTRKGSRPKISLKSCLEHFTFPESMSDVYCPSCDIKTPTQKQHTFSEFPKVLCLHLKRFEGCSNKKITEPVTFPSSLNMGPYSPYWSVFGKMIFYLSFITINMNILIFSFSSFFLH